MKPVIVIESDYEKYFERLVAGWVETKVAAGGEFKNTKIVVTAGPYRASAVTFVRSEELRMIHLDFYSALRTGFGSLSKRDIADLIELL